MSYDMMFKKCYVSILYMMLFGMLFFIVLFGVIY